MGSGAKDQNNSNRHRHAIALAYEPGAHAPKIVASGMDTVADKILEKGKENSIPVYKDEKLADTLKKLEVGAHIPPELYEVVAEILVFVSDMDKIQEKIKG
ncbi:MAG: EscU/YscU/HrcU family type III secretion system export apparatus switch protein [Lachnospiraceae bacterium]